MRVQIADIMARGRNPQLVDDSFSAAFRAMLGHMSRGVTKKGACNSFLAGDSAFDMAAQVYWCRTFAQVTPCFQALFIFTVT